MRHYIIKENGDIVGKYVRTTEPDVSDKLDIEEVEDVRNHDVIEWWTD